MARKCIDLLLSFTFLLMNSGVFSDYQFGREPRDQFIVVGNGSSDVSESFSLQCQVNYLYTNERVGWRKNGRFISINETILDLPGTDLVDSRRYTVDQQFYDCIGCGGWYKLNVTGVTPETAAMDSGKYECATVYDDFQMDQYSMTAVVTIYAVPRQNHPLCRLSSATQYNISVATAPIALTFLCLSDPGFPPVNMSWSQRNRSRDLQPSKVGQTSEGLSYIEYEWAPSNVLDINAVFTCRVQQSSILQYDSECSIGPFIEVSDRTTYVPPISESSTVLAGSFIVITAVIINILINNIYRH